MLKKILASSSCGEPHKESRGESPSTLVTPAQNTGARNIHDHGRSGYAEDPRASRPCESRSSDMRDEMKRVVIYSKFFFMYDNALLLTGLSNFCSNQCCLNLHSLRKKNLFFFFFFSKEVFYPLNSKAFIKIVMCFLKSCILLLYIS